MTIEKIFERATRQKDKSKQHQIVLLNIRILFQNSWKKGAVLRIQHP
jgi:hypothetical protein